MRIKKGLIIAAALIAALCLCACGKSEAAKVADEVINKIGTVTFDSADAIRTAREIVDALADGDKSALDNYQKLIDAENAYDMLFAQEAIDAISSIGEVTYSSGDVISAAREVYENLTAEQKALVENLDVLEDAEKQLSEKAEQFAKERIQAVIAAIDEIVEEEKPTAEQVKAVNAMLTDLSEDELAQVTNLEGFDALRELPDAERFNECIAYYKAWLETGDLFPRVYVHFINNLEKEIKSFSILIQVRDKKGELVNLDKKSRSGEYQQLLVSEGPYKQGEGQRTNGRYFEGRKWRTIGTLEILGATITYVDGSEETFGASSSDYVFGTLPGYLNNQIPNY